MQDEKQTGHVVTLAAPFSLKNQNSFFGGWPVLKDTDEQYSIAISFPVEDWQDSATVVLTETKDNLSARSFGSKNPNKAIDQALATLSLDVDDSGWEKIGQHDPVIANLQTKYGYLRPVLFHSPYEAAAGFVIGQRISVKQRQAIQKRMSDQLGQKIKVGGQEFAAFPLPQVLLEIQEFPGVSDLKIERLHGIAQAAIDGKLGRAHLLSMPIDEALEDLRTLDGIGPFYANGILYRGAGLVDDVTDDELTKYALRHAYKLTEKLTQKEVLAIAEKWRPYRMWCEVLIHVWLRREVGLPKRSYK